MNLGKYVQRQFTLNMEPILLKFRKRIVNNKKFDSLTVQNLRAVNQIRVEYKNTKNFGAENGFE